MYVERYRTLGVLSSAAVLLALVGCGDRAQETAATTPPPTAQAQPAQPAQPEQPVQQSLQQAQQDTSQTLNQASEQAQQALQTAQKETTEAYADAKDKVQQEFTQARQQTSESLQKAGSVAQEVRQEARQDYAQLQDELKKAREELAKARQDLQQAQARQDELQQARIASEQKLAEEREKVRSASNRLDDQMRRSEVATAPGAAGSQSVATTGGTPTPATQEPDTNAMGAGSSATKPADSSMARTGLQGEVNDAQITAKVNAGLAADDKLSALGIDVDTEEGVVTLKGKTSSEETKTKAASIARGVEGVKQVKNELRIEQQAAGAASTSVATMGASADMFKQLDRDGNEWLDRSEVESAPQIRDSWKQYDADNDGRITRQEFQVRQAK